MKIAHLEEIMFRMFLAGNAVYYISGIVLAFVLKDNRAFCKYLCPVTVFLKPMSYFFASARPFVMKINASIVASACRFVL